MLAGDYNNYDYLTQKTNFLERTHYKNAPQNKDTFIYVTISTVLRFGTDHDGRR